ncbi:uncharacterized protein PHALS_13410 [Plasmopara halstedii]|uniref:Retrovirus-related Pol polyprotein from transposon TNT 1-94-like beta-barrel domain-containing protein n=1 Tax=Plasmopara halstedii TaxID=4781 RepID=A0A0P1APX4_PLAHL|nr:uncharacterized protein PHALS_13410 [Plasmopara halstedii]CEG43196.1 hypothetical protein PHALS_13410 [Plasmopara halstedii]|eukprot:XP_024579565.1 hypothetical protein PHALS_13410 [Plasmopara halstedii]
MVRFRGHGGRKNKQGGSGRQDQHIRQGMKQGNREQPLLARVVRIGMGEIHMQCPQGRIVKIVDALHIPGLDRRLLSVAKLTQKGLTVSMV